MEFADHLTHAPAEQLDTFRGSLVDRFSKGEAVFAAVILAADDTGLPTREAFTAMSRCYTDGASLSSALGWDWLREWEIAGDIVAGLRQHRFQ